MIIKMKHKKYLFLILVCLIFISCNEETPVTPPDESLGYTSVAEPAQSLEEFENVLERIRTDLKIPGFSAAITKNRKIVWAKVNRSNPRDSLSPCFTN